MILSVDLSTCFLQFDIVFLCEIPFKGGFLDLMDVGCGFMLEVMEVRLEPMDGG